MLLLLGYCFLFVCFVAAVCLFFGVVVIVLLLFSVVCVCVCVCMCVCWFVIVVCCLLFCCCCFVLFVCLFLIRRVPGVFVVVFLASWISFQEPTMACTFNNGD